MISQPFLFSLLQKTAMENNQLWNWKIWIITLTCNSIKMFTLNYVCSPFNWKINMITKSSLLAGKGRGEDQVIVLWERALYEQLRVKICKSSHLDGPKPNQSKTDNKNWSNKKKFCFPCENTLEREKFCRNRHPKIW